MGKLLFTWPLWILALLFLFGEGVIVFDLWLMDKGYQSISFRTITWLDQHHGLALVIVASVAILIGFVFGCLTGHLVWGQQG